jgi:hypothetical protein
LSERGIGYALKAIETFPIAGNLRVRHILLLKLRVVHDKDVAFEPTDEVRRQRLSPSGLVP